MRKFWVALSICLWSSCAYAQFFSQVPDTSQFVTSSQVPQPSNSNPAAEALTAAPGTAPAYRRADAIIPSLWRAVTVTTSDGTGVVTGSWPTPFISTQPVAVGAEPIDPDTTSQATCKFRAISQTGYTIQCTRPGIAPTISLGIVTLFPALPVSTKVGISAREPST